MVKGDTMWNPPVSFFPVFYLFFCFDFELDSVPGWLYPLILFYLEIRFRAWMALSTFVSDIFFFFALYRKMTLILI